MSKRELISSQEINQTMSPLMREIVGKDRLFFSNSSYNDDVNSGDDYVSIL